MTRRYSLQCLKVENGRLLSGISIFPKWINGSATLESSFNRNNLVQGINADLQSLLDWGLDNKTTFEADKTAMMLVSNKRVPFDLSGIKN